MGTRPIGLQSPMNSEAPMRKMRVMTTANTGPPKSAGTIETMTTPTALIERVRTAALLAFVRRGRRNVTEAAFAAGVVEDGLQEIIGSEIGPEHRAEKELGVRGLPDQKIAHPHFARGPYDEIRIGEIVGIEMAGERFFRDFVGRGAGRDQRPHGVDQFLPAAVVERQRQHKAVVVFGQVDGADDGRAEFVGESVETADMAKLGAVAVKFVGFA